jgi:hypothetical protein
VVIGVARALYVLLYVGSAAGKASKLGNLASKISKYHYPDRLHSALLINCPPMINQMWGLAKAMLDENARNRTTLLTKQNSKKVRLCHVNRTLSWTTPGVNARNVCCMHACPCFRFAACLQPAIVRVERDGGTLEMYCALPGLREKSEFRLQQVRHAGSSHASSSK